MLRINLSRIFRALAVHRPMRFMVEKGYTYSTAQRLVTMNHTSFRLKDLEQLCLRMGCTPNDIMEWVPNQEQVDLDTPLQELRFKPEPYFDKLLNQLDYSDQLELQRLMEERIAQKKGTEEKGKEG